MLKKLLKAFGGFAKTSQLGRTGAELVEAATKSMEAGEPRAAIKLFQEYLEIGPPTADTLNNLGVCFAEIGRLEEARNAFGSAYQIDDGNMAVAVNFARHFVDSANTGEAIPFLKRAKVAIPRYPYTNVVYGAASLRFGDAAVAKTFNLKAWLALFDNNRLADSYLFAAAYADIDERELAAEHRFWAETRITPKRVRFMARPRAPGQRLRVGYWSADFHLHSVRYFFRPLLEGHDRTLVETYLFHDSHKFDGQTEKIKIACDHFFEVAGLNDEELAQKIASLGLDVLVELAGHTSSNRIGLLLNRLAAVQLTGIGYPPTTGLPTLDGKFLDSYIQTPDDSHYYSERPVVLPESFWCFDPVEPVSQASAPPSAKNGYIRFSCVGNSAKINVRMLRCWAEILRQVPRSKLVIRSVNFLDEMSRNLVINKALSEGIPAHSLEIIGPAAEKDLFESYHDVDIVLDTYPFNGGTTSCFAVYMGVPIVSLYGKSLISRMGLSILSNLGTPQLAVNSEVEYIRQAVAIATDPDFLADFRLHARTRMKASAFGNGKIFAQGVETAYLDLLERSGEARDGWRSEIDLLPPQELVTRAYVALGYNQLDAAQRIIEHCLAHYPGFAPAHILYTEKWTAVGAYHKAIDYLQEQVDSFDAEGRLSVYINVVRFQLLIGSLPAAQSTMERLVDLAPSGERDIQQIALFSARFRGDALALAPVQGLSKLRYKVLIPCDDTSLYEALVNNMKITAAAAHTVVFEQCTEAYRTDAYRRAAGDGAFDIVVLVQKNVEINSVGFFDEVATALASCDVLGYIGSKCWDRIDWLAGRFEDKAFGYVERSFEIPNTFDIKLCGRGNDKIVRDMAIIGGGLIAYKPSMVGEIDFDDSLAGAATLLEEEWTHRLWSAGRRLAVHRNLGVRLISEIALDATYLAEASIQIAESMKFDVFSSASDDNFYVSVPVASLQQAHSVLHCLFEN